MNNILVLFCLISFVKYFVNGVIYIKQNDYLQRHSLECGVIPQIDSTRTESKGRIVNGKVTNAVYPWIVQVDIHQIWISTWARATGSLVTHKVILTCGHCVCDARRGMDCELGAQKHGQLNIKDVNHIYVTLAGAVLQPHSKGGTYNPEIEAHVYNYAPGFVNGDIGIISFQWSLEHDHRLVSLVLGGDRSISLGSRASPGQASRSPSP